MVFILKNSFENQAVVELLDRFGDYYMYVRTPRGFIVQLKNPEYSLKGEAK